MTAGEREPALFDSVVARAPPLNSSGNYVPSYRERVRPGPYRPDQSRALAAGAKAREEMRPAEDERARRGGHGWPGGRTTRPTPWRDGDDGHPVAPS